MVPLPTLRQLQFFMSLVRRQSFSKAAEECLVSQSTLSSAIKEMEAVLGQTLVDRSTRSFALTPVGEDVASRAPSILASVEDMARSVGQQLPLDGEFHLGVIPTIAPFLLPKATTRLKRKYPNLALFLREDLTASLGERLSAGLLDAAILALPYELPGIEVIEVGADPFLFACEPDHKFAGRKTLKKEALVECDLLLLEDGHCLREHAIDACEIGDRNTRDAFSATSLFTLTQMARAGLGATLLPEMAVRGGLSRSAGLVTIPFSKPVPKRMIGVAWRKGSGREDEAEAIADILSGLF